LGFAFKAGTDDLRESPIVEVIERLLGKGDQLTIYDSSVNMVILSGTNREFLMIKIPHIARLMVDNVDEVVTDDATLVIGNNAVEISTIPEQSWGDIDVIDLSGSIP
jgi:GDP-mannose 6-dehydrogenase